MGYGLVITVALLAAYMGLLYWLARTGRMERYNLSLLLGFILMVRTHRGRATLDRLSRPKRFWNAFGDLGTAVTLAGMALMTVFLLYAAWRALVPDPDVPLRALEAREILVIPGVNPFVPLWYGIIALIVTLVVHEGGHGVLARANHLRVRSLGLLVLVLPIGAFVEPDESELMASSRRKRLRVFGAGPMVNIVFALLTMALFAGMFAAASPVEGAPLTAVIEDSPAHQAGIEPLAVITAVDGRRVRDVHDLSFYVDSRRVEDTVHLEDSRGRTYDVQLMSYWDALTPEQQETIEARGRDAVEEAQADPHMGVNFYDDARVGGIMRDPFGQTDGRSNLLFLIALPIGEAYNQPFLSVYLPGFYEAPWGGAAYTATMILMFYVFWINLMVGLTNILPMLPFDGGHIFRDAFGAIFDRVRPGMDPQRRDRIIGRTAGVVSLTILFGILATIIGPRLV